MEQDGQVVSRALALQGQLRTQSGNLKWRIMLHGSTPIVRDNEQIGISNYYTTVEGPQKLISCHHIYYDGSEHWSLSSETTENSESGPELNDVVMRFLKNNV